MAKLLMWLALSGLALLAALAGSVVLLVGWFKKKRGLKVTGGILVVLSMMVLAGCLLFGSAKVVHKLKNTGRKEIWHAIVDRAFDDTGVQACAPATAKQILGTNIGGTSFLRGTNIEGVWVAGVVLDYGYFLYIADEKELLRAVSAAPVDPSWKMASDDVCKEATWAECKELLMYEKGPEHNLPGWAPNAVAEKHCYRCFRAPWQHSILIDEKTRMVYHAISECRD
jgi:hypothetical protein